MTGPPDRTQVVAAAFERDGHHQFSPRHWSDTQGLDSDREVARRTAQLRGWAVTVVTSQRDHRGRVSVYAMVLDGPDDLALRLFQRLGYPTASQGNEPSGFLEEYRRDLGA